jgi:hypothetical protein
MPIEPNNIVLWTGGGAAALTIVTMVIRYLAKSIRSERLDLIAAKADVGSYARMQDEIKRLSAKIIELEEKVDTLKNVMNEDVYDLSKLAVLLSNMPCGNCDIPSDIFREAERSVNGIINRKHKATE